MTDNVTREPVHQRRTARLGRAATIATAALLLTGSGAFAANQLTSTTALAGGAKTPEAAVEAMLTSLEQNDLLGVADHLAAGEREVVRDVSNDYVNELQRLDIVDESLDLANVPGFELSFDDMTYDVEQANARVWLVEITGGEMTVGANAADLPIGSVILDRIGPLPEGSETETIDVADALAELDPMPRIAVIEESGRYFVSSFYTAAETIAAEAGYELPATPIPAVGAASPEAAVRELVAAGIDLDLSRVIELTPPEEMAALHDYGPILVELADQAIAESDIEDELAGVTITIDALELDTVAVTGGTKVLPTHIAVRVESDEFTASFSATKVDETCIEYEFEATSTVSHGSTESERDAGRYCASDIYEAFEGTDVPVAVQQIAERLIGQLGRAGAVTVEVDGQWYVSPSRTGSDLFLLLLQGLERADIEVLLDLATDSRMVSDIHPTTAPY